MTVTSPAPAGDAVATPRRLSARWPKLLRLAPAAGPGLLTVSVLINLALGLLPLGFLVAVSMLLARVPAVLASQTGWASPAVPLAVACITFAVHQSLAPLQSAVGDLIARRVDGRCINELMTTALRDAAMPALDSTEVLDLLADSRAALDRAMPTPGDAVAGGLALVARYTQLTGAVLLVGIALSPWAATIVATTALTVRFGQRGSLARFARVWKGLAGSRRRMTYVRAFASSTPAAKEIRLLGLHDWFRTRQHAEAGAYLGPLWRQRRRILQRPFLGLAAAALLGGSTALTLLALAGVPGHLSLLNLAVAAQATIVTLRFGVFFPESDPQTQYGLEGFDALRRLNELTVTHPRTPATRITTPLSEVKSGIRFTDVRFRYPGSNREVLSGIDLNLPAGSSTALVGLNGAGKTTLLKLLTGVHEPSAGRIEVDGRALTGPGKHAWQSQVAVIFQDYVRYELSAATNIRLGAPHVRDDEEGIREAARRAGILEVLDRLPHGLETILARHYPGGRELSGGQWQRIALARAFYAVRHGASVLVLDEPTAMLDVRAEVEFHDRFLELTEGLTSLVISHRFSTVRRADQIVVLEHGRVAERGTHEHLLRADGRYARLFHLQAGRFGPETVQ
ncbi:ATP-binding cassette domain-containing protein [Actinoplanes sp. NPDC048791]|uniref:ABC transporter ATP-binding protein n=1 Tax=Actinoplanes sp. NPDC048791 TaxID=3154623 RepID=UPI0033F60BA7